MQKYFDQVVIPYYLKLLAEEDNKEVIERVLENLRDMSADLGPAVF